MCSRVLAQNPSSLFQYHPEGWLLKSSPQFYRRCACRFYKFTFSGLEFLLGIADVKCSSTSSLLLPRRLHPNQ
ncbi:hypothetical protein SeLEV6574_g05639 [Synchytrium endobioticum]|uniref:Uncharacterized protein n=1 Tax=Synchytrium endobioticum TaxID=286115 RepID=A0A507CT63_9FUNG|nr:hypothetical protein SeLEV6574_g05639 [Synchytrium endobioticum]